MSNQGNVVILALIDEFGADAIRYFAARDQLGSDGNFRATR
ncbi:MAG: hypothetical protein ACLRXQ_03055 [Phascolarctobacterium faecium]